MSTLIRRVSNLQFLLREQLSMFFRSFDEIWTLTAPQLYRSRSNVFVALGCDWLCVSIFRHHVLWYDSSVSFQHECRTDWCSLGVAEVGVYASISATVNGNFRLVTVSWRHTAVNPNRHARLTPENYSKHTKEGSRPIVAWSVWRHSPPERTVICDA